MKVVPNALPKINPTIDLQVIARTLPAEFLETRKVFTTVEAGVFLRPKLVYTLLSNRLPINAFIH